jgi:hypothetical protein
MAIPDTPEPRVRPNTVTWAVYAIYALAALAVISGLLTLLPAGAVIDAAREAAGDAPEAEAVVSVIRISIYGWVALSVLFAIGWVVLGIFVGKGMNPARITAWVLLGLWACCNGFNLAGNALGGIGGNTQGGVDQAELNRRIEEAAGTYQAIGLVSAALTLIAAVAAIILLALPASNDYFRRRAAATDWEPPVPGTGLPPAGGPPSPPPYNPPPPGPRPED